MKYCFKRIDTLNGNGDVVRKMSLMNQQLGDDLYELCSGEASEDEVRAFCQAAIADGMPLEKNPDLVFWGYDHPEHMPSDARCEFFYQPTYLMVLMLANAILRYPDLIHMIGMKDALDRGFAGCGGRRLMGHGIDGVEELYDNLLLFLKSGYCDFHLRYPEIGQSFWTMFQQVIHHVHNDYESGHHTNEWGVSYSKQQETLLSLVPCWIDENYELEPGYLYNIAYGANMDVKKMKSRCPDAELVGIGRITGMRLEFHKYATLMKTGNETDCVPVALWRISPQDEQKLDRYEGVPSYYYKSKATINLNNGKDVEGTLYLMNTIREEPVDEHYFTRLEKAYQNLGQGSSIRSVLHPAKYRSEMKYRMTK